MSLTSLTSLMGSNCKINGDKGDFFDLLGCPDDVINRFFSFLDPEDRIRMRLNKRTNKIVAESKYFVERVELKQSYLDQSKCVIMNDRNYPFEFISKIAPITSIGELKIVFPDSVEVAHKFYNIIKEFRCITVISICFWSGEIAEILTDSFFLELPRRCESLNFNNCPTNVISPENLHEMYQVIVDHSTSVQSLKINLLNLKTVRAFLHLLEISFKNGRVISNRNIEAYKSSSHYDEDYVNIVDGCARILFVFCRDDEEDWRIRTSIEITFHKNQESLNRFKYNISLMERKCTGENGEFFNLSGCPDEVIEQFLLFLGPGDRMRMRLNKRLYNIEGQSQYFIKKVKLDEPNLDENSKCVNIKGREYPFDFICRIAHNTSIGRLSVSFPDSIELTRKFCNIITEFRTIKQLWIYFPRRRTTLEITTNSFFIDLSRRCEILDLTSRARNNYQISPNILHSVYKSMKDGSGSVRHVRLSSIKIEYIHAFLNFLGISFREDQLISNLNIEAYAEYIDDDGDDYILNIFDGFIQIVFVVYIEDFNNEIDNLYRIRKIEIELHENQEALNRAKNGREGCNRIRMDVYPE